MMSWIRIEKGGIEEDHEETETKEWRQLQAINIYRDG
jgi:hypothetical protein